MYKEVENTYRLHQFHCFFFLIAWGRLGKFAPDFLHFCVESSESRKVLGVGQRQILLAATWITSNDGSSLVGLRRRPWFCMATVQCRPCTPKVNRPPRLVNVSTTTRAIFNKPCCMVTPLHSTGEFQVVQTRGKGKGKVRKRELPSCNVSSQVIKELLALLQ